VPVKRKGGKDVLVVAKPRKNITLCPIWFFGGPHQWDVPLVRCKPRPKAAYIYGPRAKKYDHEWPDHKGGMDGRPCIHCGLTRKQIKPGPKVTDKCANCGVTRGEATRQAMLGEQERLGCEDFGHTVKRKSHLRPGKVRLAELIAQSTNVVDLSKERRNRRKKTK
jgi:hypothetical protein